MQIQPRAGRSSLALKTAFDTGEEEGGRKGDELRRTKKERQRKWSKDRKEGGGEKKKGEKKEFVLTQLCLPCLEDDAEKAAGPCS